MAWSNALRDPEHGCPEFAKGGGLAFQPVDLLADRLDQAGIVRLPATTPQLVAEVGFRLGGEVTFLALGSKGRGEGAGGCAHG